MSRAVMAVTGKRAGGRQAAAWAPTICQTPANCPASSDNRVGKARGRVKLVFTRHYASIEPYDDHAAPTTTRVKAGAAKFGLGSTATKASDAPLRSAQRRPQKPIRKEKVMEPLRSRV